MKKFLDFATENPWKTMFLYSLCVAILVQGVLLPFVFPHLHAGHGMLRGGDWIDYHHRAVLWGPVLREQGWKVYRTKDYYDGPNIEQNLLTFIYAYSPVDRPWILIPLLAFAHATAAWLLFLIIRMVTASPSLAFLGALPYLVFPSSIIWVSQVHKDGFAFLGVFLNLWAWSSIAKMDWRAKTKEWLPSLAVTYIAFLASIAITSACRGYLVNILVYVVGPLSLVCMLPRVIQLKFPLIRTAFLFALSFLVVWTGQKLFPGWGVEFKLHESAAKEPPPPVIVAPRSFRRDASQEVKTWESINRSESSEVAEAPAVPGVPRRPVGPAAKTAVASLPKESLFAPVWNCNPRWTETKGIPKAIENASFALANVRKGYIFTESNSNFETDRAFCRTTDLVKYVPRALVFGLFAPFPLDLDSTGNDMFGSFAFRISTLEMKIAYVALPFLFWLLVAYRRAGVLWGLVGCCLALIIIYTEAVPNMGTLHRFRYGFLTPLIGLGLCGLVGALSRLKTSKFFYTDLLRTTKNRISEPLADT